MSNASYRWSDTGRQIAEVSWGAGKPSWLVLEELSEVLQRDTLAAVPREVLEGIIAQGQWLFDFRGDWSGKRDYNGSRSKVTGEDAPREPYSSEERVAWIVSIQEVFEDCEARTIERFWLELWEQWLASKHSGARAWIIPTFAMYENMANAYRLLEFYLKHSDCYLVRNMGIQQSGLVLLDWELDVARYVLDAALHHIREDYERKALRHRLEVMLQTREDSVKLDDLLEGTQPDFGLDEQGKRVFDLGTRQIEITCELGTRSITWRELPRGKEIKGFPRKKKSDEELGFALSRLQYRAMRAELERAYL